MSARGMAQQQWKSSADIRLRESSPAPAAETASAKPSSTRSDDFLPWISEVSVKKTVDDESPLPSIRNETAIPHHPAQIIASPMVPPALRSSSSADWRPTGTISATQATALRQRISQGEKIFKRERDNSQGVLDRARGRKGSDGAASDASRPMHGGLQ
jgi:hypothetical protein